MDFVLNQLQQEGLLSAEAAEQARSLAQQGTPIEQAILSADGLSEEQLLKFFQKTFDMPFVELENREISKELLGKFPTRILVQHHLLPLEDVDGHVTIATSSPLDTSGLDELRLLTGRDFRTVLATSSEIDRCLKQTLGLGADTLQDLAQSGDGIQVLDTEDEGNLDLDEAAQDASIIKFVNQILVEAINLRATDIHFEPFENLLRVRYRIDGVLQETNIPANVRRFQAAIVSRIKILSHLDIAEKRLPQDGRIKLKIAGREIDVRVSIIPMLHGEAVVLRILSRGEMKFGIEYLGMSPRDKAAFMRVLDLPHGIALVTGPTGSGKTTTLYAGLSQINDLERKIITIEDPVEYHLQGINQIQVSTKTGLTFAAGLRAVLRHDPDVVLIGEIRDVETAEIAVQASLTGHLVFSTLHTNDAPSAAARLIDMGVEPYLVASSVEMVVAQRLVRVLCPNCKEPISSHEMTKLKKEFGREVPDTVFQPKGCRQCLNTGYHGRVGIFEMMPMTDEIRSLVLRRAASGEIRKIAMQQGMSSLRMDGWRVIGQGVTSVEEVLRATKDESFAATSSSGSPAGVQS